MLSHLLKWFREHALWDVAKEFTKWLWATGGAVVTGIAQAIGGWMRGHQDLTALCITGGMVAALLVVAYITHRVPAHTQRQPIEPEAPKEPTLSALDYRTHNTLKTEFDLMPFHEKLTLCVIYHNPPKIHHLFLVQQIRNYGFGRDLLNDIINPVMTHTSFVKQDAVGDIEPHPVHHKMIQGFLTEWQKWPIC